jgi:branched-chain amino acid transport system permease protein
MTRATKAGLWIVAAVALVVWPWLTDDRFLHHVGVLILLTAIGAASLHLIIRTGHVSLCHAAFMAFGAYGSVLTVMRLGLPFPAGLLVGTGIAALVAAMIGPVVLRLTGKYFVLITFLLGEVVRMAIVENVALTGGSNGIFNVPPPHPIFLDTRAYYYLALGFAVLSIGLCARILGSELGRAMNSMRDSERLAECSGIPVIRFKVVVFIIACGMAGMQGSLMAHYNKVLSPENFSGLVSLNLVVMNVIGGMSSLVGALIGTVFMVMLPELLRGWVNIQHIIFGAILFATMAFMPGGIIEAIRRIKALVTPPRVATAATALTRPSAAE